MIRSYSRPSWPRTFSTAERIFRAFSSLVKSVNGSFTNEPECRRTCGRIGASTVAMIAPQEIDQKGTPSRLFILTPQIGLGHLDRIAAFHRLVAQRRCALQFVPGESLPFERPFQCPEQHHRKQLPVCEALQ